VIKSDATVVTTQAEENDVLRMAHLRLNEFTSDELAARGDLKAVQMCGPRTLKITEDIQSIGTESAVSVKHKLFWSRSTGEQHEDFRVSINTIVEDCVTGKRLESFTYDNHGIDLVAVLKTTEVDRLLPFTTVRSRAMNQRDLMVGLGTVQKLAYVRSGEANWRIRMSQTG
jgi:hypothetical protein